MPSKWYRRNLRNNISQKQVSVIYNIRKEIFTDSGKEFINKIQKEVYKILDSITLRMELDKVLLLASDLNNSLKNKKNALELLKRIEHSVLSIIDNIACRIDLGIVLQRIHYVRELINKLSDMDSIFCTSYDGPIANMILEIFTMLGKSVDIDNIHKSILSVYDLINKSIKNQEYIRDLEKITITIFENIACRIDLGIITQRIVYLQEVISKIDKDSECIFYNSYISQEIINIITLFSNINTNKNDIIIEIDKINDKIKSLHDVLSKQIECINILKESETLTLSIVDNLVCRIDLGIVTNRIIYLQGLIKKVQTYEYI
jgi:hypothetical protein